MKRFVSFLCVLFLMMASFTAGMVYPRGDVDQNGEVNVGDVVILIDYLLTGVWNETAFTPDLETYTVNGVTFSMVKVKGGTFTMGATDEQGDEANDWEKPTHRVTLSDYSIGQTEVTQELWQAVMGSNPSYYTGNPQLPVENVTWNMCRSFVNKLKELTGLNFRLPTEAEWEFAARGGYRTRGYKYSGSDNINDVAWCWDNLPSQDFGEPGYGTQPVATRSPNELGAYDMSGNVWEWCQDWYGNYSSVDQSNPTGAFAGMFRIFRGGSWSRSAECCRVSYRNFYYPETADSGMGLRLAL